MLVAAFAFLGAAIVFCIAFPVTHGAHERSSAIAAIAAVGPFVPLFFSLFTVFAVVPFLARNTEKPNHPRINHLRIAGKYRPQGFTARECFSPLRLR